MASFPSLTRNHVLLMAAGCIAEAIWVCCFLVPFPLLRFYTTDTDMAGITGHSIWGFCLFLGSIGLQFLILAFAAVLAARVADRLTVWIIFCFGAIFATTLVFVYPVTATDLFTYVAQSRILAHYHQNPVFVAPARHPHDAFMQLAGGWMHSTSPYGPLGILADALPVLPAGNSLLASLLLEKTFFSVLLLVEGLLVVKIARQMGLTGHLAATLVLWNPLILFEVCANGHNDIILIVLASAGLLFMLRGDVPAAIVSLVLGCLVKYTPAPLLLVFIAHAVTRPATNWTRAKTLAHSLAVSAIVAVSLYAPFWRGWATFNRSFREDQFHIESFSAFITSLLPSLSLGEATDLGRVIFIPIAVYCLWLATKGPKEFIKSCFLITFVFLGAAAANFKIWYATLPSAIGATGDLTDWAAVWLMGCGTTLSAAIFAYPFVWAGESSQAWNVVNVVTYLMTFGVAGGWLLAKAIGKARMARMRLVAGLGSRKERTAAKLPS